MISAESAILRTDEDEITSQTHLIKRLIKNKPKGREEDTP